MDPAGGLPDMDGHLLKEGDHVVIGPLFDLTHLLDAEGSLLADRLGILLGDDPKLGHSLTGQSLDLKPDFQFSLLRPNGAHLGAAVAFNHRATLAKRSGEGSWFYHRMRNQPPLGKR